MSRDLYEKCGSDNLFHAFIHEDDAQIECISAPTLDVVQRWLREVHKLHITIFSSSQESWMFRITKPHQQLEDGIYGEDFETFEDAQDAAIKKCLEILK
jgi:hypothetical protein